jgi:hypothetical protein
VHGHTTTAGACRAALSNPCTLQPMIAVQNKADNAASCKLSIIHHMNVSI